MTIKRDPYTMQGQKITDEGQALTQSESHSEARHHTAKGVVFMLASGFVTHNDSADTFTGIMWFRNDSTEDQVFVGYMRSCNEVPGKWRLKRGVTELSSNTTITAQNMNIGSPKTFEGTIEAGNAPTSVFTGGTVVGQWIQGGPAHSDPDWQGAFTLSPGASMGLEFAPFAAASNNEACVTVEVWQAGLLA